ncbi:hypothetical protein RND71_018515 [Anisodus tanguticus]|uniref:Uncharacterized protein n=1 Tax=Anisodus tanguticus TaxID=243964 RepID=A0AAE1S5I2_9SOLA|nr:hypothetical protein RND71_018515 [Anisodus tanguticus]
MPLTAKAPHHQLFISSVMKCVCGFTLYFEVSDDRGAVEINKWLSCESFHSRRVSNERKSCICIGMLDSS